MILFFFQRKRNQMTWMKNSWIFGQWNWKLGTVLSSHKVFENSKPKIHQRNMTCSIWPSCEATYPPPNRHCWVDDFPSFPSGWDDVTVRFPLGDVEEGPFEAHCCCSSLLYCLKRMRDGWQMARGGSLGGADEMWKSGSFAFQASSFQWVLSTDPNFWWLLVGYFARITSKHGSQSNNDSIQKVFSFLRKRQRGCFFMFIETVPWKCL